MTAGLARKLSRTKPHREALLRNLVTQLLQHGSIQSTHQKCKEASRLADKVVNMAKRANSDTTPEVARRKLISNIQSRLYLAGDNKHLLNRLLDEIAPNYTSRNGGYTRVLRLEPRKNDSAELSVLELVQTPVVVDGKGFQRGNLKFWLLVKNTLMDESSGGPYRQLTLLNLKKILKFKTREGFIDEMMFVRKSLKTEAGVEFDSVKERLIVERIVDQIDQLPPMRGKNVDTVSQQELKGGYRFVDKRPPRPETV